MEIQKESISILIFYHTSGYSMQIKNLKDRRKFLQTVHSKPAKFKFKYIGDFSEKIKPIQDYFHNDMQWLGHGEDSWIYFTHGQVSTYTILNVPNFAQIEIPYKAEPMVQDKKVLELCSPIINELESLYNGKVGMVGFNKLPPGHSMPSHRDQIDGAQPFSPYYKVLRRFHIPLFTNDQAYIKVGREVKNMKVGECWEFNNNLFHEVWNDGDTDRIHFIIDILPYRWL